MMKNETWFKWYPARYRADTMHLTAEQDGIYRRLIDHYMETSQPLPDSLMALGRITGVTPDELEKHWPVIASFFRHEAGKLYLKVCEELIRERFEKAERFKAYGHMGGRPKKNPEQNPQDSLSQRVSKPDKIREDKRVSSLRSDTPPIVPPEKKSWSDENSEAGEDQGLDMLPVGTGLSVVSENTPDHGKVAGQDQNSPEAIKIEKKGKSKNDKGTRLNEWLQANGPSDGKIPPDWVEWVDRKYRWDDETIGHIAERFWRYFTGPDAKEPRKKDWKRAFQTWCDRDLGTAQAFIRSRAGAGGGQGKGYSGAVADSTKQALSLIEAGAGASSDDMPDFGDKDSD